MKGCWVELWELVDELSKEPLAGALEAADAANVLNLSSADPLLDPVHEEVVELPGAFFAPPPGGEKWD